MRTKIAIAISMALVSQTVATYTFAAEKSAESSENEVLVKDKADSMLTSGQSLSAEEIKQRPTGDGNLTELLKSNPAVQFSNSGNSSMNQGEIKPDDISIHGSTSYQNAFNLDGMSINNDLDPADNRLGVTSSTLGSDEQGFYLDSRLIDGLTVYDANIPVEFGGFTGGVVDVSSRSWQGETKANVHYRTTRSDWNKTHVDDQLDFNSGHNDMSHPARFQPEYKKQSYGAWIETGITDDLGFVLSVSRRESTIPMTNVGTKSFDLDSNNKLYEFTTQDQITDQTRASNNLFGKLTWYATPRTTAHWSMTYSGYNAELFMNGIANSDYTEDHDGLASSLNIEHAFDFAMLDLSASVQRMRDKRDSEQNYTVNFVDIMDTKTKHVSGGPGDLTTTQDNAAIKAKLSFDPITWGGTVHGIKLGAEVTHTDAEFDRKETYYQNTFAGMKNGKDYQIYSSAVDAFFAGIYTTRYTNYGLFMDDTIVIGDLSVRPGIRLDRDDFVGQNNIAPRLSTSWDIFGNSNTVLTAGVNRYYGRSMLTYALYEGQNAGLKHCRFNCEPNSPTPDNSWDETPDFEGMDELSTPYNDEFAFSVQQRWQNSIIKLNYVHRDGRDEVRSRQKYPDADKRSLKAKIRSFDNNGESTHDSVILSARNALPMRWGGTENHIMGSLTWQETTSNTPKDQGYAFYDLQPDLNLDKVWYDGKIIDAEDLPSTDFNAPWLAKLEWSSKLKNYDITIYNLLNWQSKREQATRRENEYAKDPETDKQILKYESVDFASTFRWDTKVLWEPSFAKGAAVSVEVNNLLNNKNATDSFVLNDKVYKTYEPGRQFWLQVSYDY